MLIFQYSLFYVLCKLWVSSLFRFTSVMIVEISIFPDLCNDANVEISTVWKLPRRRDSLFVISEFLTSAIPPNTFAKSGVLKSGSLLREASSDSSAPGVFRGSHDSAAPRRTVRRWFGPGVDTVAAFSFAVSRARLATGCAGEAPRMRSIDRSIDSSRVGELKKRLRRA